MQIIRDTVGSQILIVQTIVLLAWKVLRYHIHRYYCWIAKMMLRRNCALYILPAIQSIWYKLYVAPLCRRALLMFYHLKTRYHAN